MKAEYKTRHTWRAQLLRVCLHVWVLKLLQVALRSWCFRLRLAYRGMITLLLNVNIVDESINGCNIYLTCIFLYFGDNYVKGSRVSRSSAHQFLHHHWYQQNPQTSVSRTASCVPYMGTTTHTPVTVQHAVNPLHRGMSASFIFSSCVQSSVWSFGFCGLIYLVITSNWFLSSSCSDFESHIFIYKEWFTDLFLYALERWVLHHSSRWSGKSFVLLFASLLDSYLVVDFFGFLLGCKETLM